MDELYFTSDSVKLLDYFQIPFRIIHGNRTVYSNGAGKESMDWYPVKIMDKSSVMWDEEIIDYVNIGRSSLRVDVKRHNSKEHLLLKVSFNGSSCNMIVSSNDCREWSFRDCIGYFNNEKKFEKIIVVDDDPTVSQTYRYILDFLGYQTFLFPESSDALEVLKTEDFDLLISDYNMPGLNGFELVKRVMEIKPDLPVIICSGMIDCYKDMFNSLSVRHHITLMKKPVSIKKISDILEVMEFISKICSFCRDKDF